MCQCKKKIGIAKKSRFRFITTCKHNAVHAHWDNVTLSWQLHDFQRFAEMVRQRVMTNNIPEPSVMLRINNVAVGWQTADFIIFSEMVLEASDRLEHGMAVLNTKQPIQKPVSTTHLNNKFSLN